MDDPTYATVTPAAPRMDAVKQDNKASWHWLSSLADDPSEKNLEINREKNDR